MNEAEWQKIDKYLRDINEYNISSPTKINTETHLKKLEILIPQLNAPDMCPSYCRDVIMLVWQNDVHYLECEIWDNGVIEWFYRNFITDELYSEDVTISTAISGRTLELLNLFRGLK